MSDMDAVDIDVDLFNDGQLDGQLDQIITADHALPTTGANPGLAEQFLNQQFCGGTSRVSWSRQGHIAVISEDGSSVSLHCLRADPRTKEWKLSAPRALEAVFENAVMVAWSPTGFDLAVLDNRGRFATYSMTTTAINRLSESKSMQVDSPDDSATPIGLWWLSQDRHERSRNLVTTATKSDGGNKWAHNTAKAKSLGPMYPRAFCTVDRQGILSLVYQRPGARYTRTSIPLPALSGVACTHAAFSPTTMNKILLAVHTANGDLAVYIIQINWPQNMMTDLTSTDQPKLLVHTVNNRVSMWSEESDGESQMLHPSYKPDDWSLTYLSIIPTTELEDAAQDSPSIWAVYTSTNRAINANDGGYLMNSVIRRWSVYPISYQLHPRFDDIPTKTELPANDEEKFVVRRDIDMNFPHTITSIQQTDGGLLIAISTGDGRVDFWNPSTRSLVSYDAQTTEVTSLVQSGFTFDQTSNALDATLSPNASVSLDFVEEQKPSVRCTRYSMQNPSQDLDFSNPHQSASVAAVILTFARSCWSNTNGDDVLACAVANYTAQQCPSLIQEMYRTLFRDTDFIHEKAPGSEVERLATKPILNRVLSFQLAVMNHESISIASSDENIRFASLSGIWAWVTINLRYVATTFYLFYREYQAIAKAQQNPSGPQNLTQSPSFVDAICNTIHWTMDLFRFMVTTILDIGDRQSNPDFFTPTTFANNLGDVKGDGSQGLVALILNCQWSRTFLIAIHRALRAFIDSNDQGHNPYMGRIVHTMRRYSDRKGMHFGTIEKILDPRWYVRAGLRDGESMENATVAKRQMVAMSTGRLGPEFSTTLRTLLDKVINDPETGLRATGEIERLKLWTDAPDLNWLLLGLNSQFWTEAQATNTTTHALNNVNGVDRSTRKLYDVHRKSQIINLGTPDQLVRRCVRCGSLSGDVDGIDKMWSKHMIGYLSKCVCDAQWILESIDGEKKGT